MIHRPTLAEIRELWHAQGGEPGTLPPIAGAGGSWTLTVPTQEKPGGIEFITNPTPLVKLLAGPEFAPQLRERWHFTGFRIPVAVQATSEEALTPGPIFTTKLTIRRNGDVVYTESKETQGIANKPAINKSWVATVLFGADLINPFTLMQGQQLTLEVSLTYSKGKGFLGVLFLSAEVEVAGENAVFQPVERGTFGAHGLGVMYYTSETLTGHRTL